MLPYRSAGAVEPWYPRAMPRWASILEPFLSNFRWFRRLVGGRWERWYVEVCHASIWHYIDEWTYWTYRGSGRARLPCCFGTPTVEEHPYRR